MQSAAGGQLGGRVQRLAILWTTDLVCTCAKAVCSRLSQLQHGVGGFKKDRVAVTALHK